jgi:predicted small lipoprotein YifL
MVVAVKGALERVLEHRRLKFPRRELAAATAIIAALGLSGCGRSGPLEPPPGPAVPPAPSAQLTQPDGSPVPGSPQDTAARTGFDQYGNPVATPGQKRPFILDPLLQ